MSESTSSDDDVTVVAACLMLLPDKDSNKKRRQRSCWVRPWVSRRQRHGAYYCLMKELRLEDKKSYTHILRMQEDNFQQLLTCVAPIITRKDTPMRDAIPPGERLAITLRYLATGENYSSLQYFYRIPKNTLSSIIPETCQAIYDSLKEEFLKVPRTKEEWQSIAKGFQDRWNFPNYIGAIDGKHVSIVKPHKSGSQFFNYKHFFSVVLLAMVDADYKFLYVDVGANGRESDAGIFANSPLYKALVNNELNLPNETPLHHLGVKAVPLVVVGDDAFPLKTTVMKPYPARDIDSRKRIFNYRLSRARRVSENDFGILSARFRVFQKPIPLSPLKVEQIVLAATSLHNFLRSRCDTDYFSPYSTDSESASFETVPGEWRQNYTPLTPVSQQGGNRHSILAHDVRNELCNYFNDKGQVSWQWNKV